MEITLTDFDAESAGEAIIKLLKLKPSKARPVCGQPLYRTSKGEFSAKGIGRIVLKEAIKAAGSFTIVN